MTTNCAIIPARVGSKGVPDKNTRPLFGHPMFVYSIIAAQGCTKIDRIIVTTDGPGIAQIATQYGAEVPFMRPPELAGDTSPPIDFMIHAMDQLAELDNYLPDLLVLLLPTTPLRDPAKIDEAISQLEGTPDATGLRSAHEMTDPPQKMMGIKDGYLTGLYPQDPRPEYFNLPRQAFPPSYHPNGYVEIVRRETLINDATLYGPKILGFITPFTIEIDAPEDFEYLEYFVEHHGHPLVDQLNNLYGNDEAAGKA